MIRYIEKCVLFVMCITCLCLWWFCLCVRICLCDLPVHGCVIALSVRMCISVSSPYVCLLVLFVTFVVYGVVLFNVTMKFVCCNKLSDVFYAACVYVCKCLLVSCVLNAMSVYFVFLSLCRCVWCMMLLCLWLYELCACV